VRPATSAATNGSVSTDQEQACCRYAEQMAFAAYSLSLVIKSFRSALGVEA